jgi:hypothetical protein
MFLGLPSHPEDRGYIFETSVYTSTGLDGVTYKKTALIIGFVFRLRHGWFFLGLPFDPENGDSAFL